MAASPPLTRISEEAAIALPPRARLSGRAGILRRPGAAPRGGAGPRTGPLSGGPARFRTRSLAGGAEPRDRLTVPPSWLRPSRPRQPRHPLITLILLSVAAIALAATITVLTAKALTAHRPVVRTPLLLPAPAVAGGFPRQYLPVLRTSAQLAIADLRGRFSGNVMHGARARYPAGLYREPGVIDPSAGSTGWIMYLGYNLPESSPDRAAAARSLMSALAPGASAVTEAPGKRGGVMLCARAALGGTNVAVCVWAARWTTGAVISPVQDTAVSELSTLVSRMRLDLQPG